MSIEMEEDDQGFRWPEDMERRRVADLRKFQRNNPDYKVTKQKQREGKSHNLSSENPCLPLKIKLGRPQSNLGNRWSLETTLELLEGMKAYVRANKLCQVGEKQWIEIAINLSNPRNLELRRLARSSMIKFSNLGRILRGDKAGKVEFEIQKSMAEYVKICNLHQAPGSAKSSITTTLEHSQQSSPSPLSTPATGKCLNHPSVERKKLHTKDRYAMLLSEDCSSDSNDDYVSSLGSKLGNSQLRSLSAEAQNVAQAGKCDSSNPILISDSSEDFVSRATPTRFSARRRPETASIRKSKTRLMYGR